MSKLYSKVSDLAFDDATVYQHLKMQEKTSMGDFDTAVALIRSLVHEKKAYFDDAVRTRSMSIVPLMIPKDHIFRPIGLLARIRLFFAHN